MAKGPTTINGPLHTTDASIGQRRITAFFATRQQAEATQAALLGAGIPSTRISITDAKVDGADLEAAEQTLLGRIREAVLPDDGQTGERAAVASGDIRLVIRPEEEDVTRIVEIIEAGNPHHFDADLERWRNLPSSD